MAKTVPFQSQGVGAEFSNKRHPARSASGLVVSPAWPRSAEFCGVGWR